MQSKWMFVACSIVFASSALADAPIANYKVKVEGKSFRVRVQGDTVKSIPKAAIAGQSLAQRDRLRAAVVEATGCKIVDDYWDESRLAGKLQCPQGHEMPSPK
jgi:hypothetical protein